MKKPNLLFIYTDQQRFDSLSVRINGQLVMPNLHAFAACATVFDQAYCTQPVCTPSRATLVTCLWPHQNGILNNNISLHPDTRCVPEMLPVDYATGHFGKWHLGDEIYPQHGFQEWRSIDDTYWPFYSAGRDPIHDRSSHHHWLVEHGVTPWPVDKANTLVSCPQWHAASQEKRRPYDENRFSREQITQLPEPLSKPSYLADEAIQFLHQHQREPFALYVNFFEPHHPLSSPRNEQFDPAAVSIPVERHDLPDETVPLGAAQAHRAQYDGSFDGTPVASEADLRKAIAIYWGMCALVDTHIGRILQTLTELGLDENTLVFFTTDHGELLGAHGMWGKGVMYEPSIRVPMMMRMPGQRQGERVARRVSQIDVVPTLLDCLGVARQDSLPGVSLRDATPRDVIIQWNAMPGATGDKAESARTIITTDGWKLTLSTHARHELRHLDTDPHELTNVIRSQPEKAAALRARIEAWQKETGDQLVFPSF